MVKNGRNRNVWPRPGSTSFALLVAAVRTRPIGKSTRISSNSKIARLPQPRAGHYRECGHHANHSLDLSAPRQEARASREVIAAGDSGSECVGADSGQCRALTTRVPSACGLLTQTAVRC
jgi:hypothetical protein